MWSWNKARLRGAKLRQGAYLLRTNLDPMDPDALWRQYVQLTEVEAAFRALKSELAIRPIWHRIQRRVEAHILVAFLGYCLWVCLKQKLKMVAESITPARALESLRSIFMVEVWFRLRDGRHLCLSRITEPEKEQALLLHHLGWNLPEQPPPRVYSLNFKTLVWQTGAVPEKPFRSKSVLMQIPAQNAKQLDKQALSSEARQLVPVAPDWHPGWRRPRNLAAVATQFPMM